MIINKQRDYMFRISCANILTSIVAIISIFGTDPIFAADAQPRTTGQIERSTIPASQPEKKNIFQQAANGISKGASSAWNATSNFVSGIFKGDEPCSEKCRYRLTRNRFQHRKNKA